MNSVAPQNKILSPGSESYFINFLVPFCSLSLNFKDVIIDVLLSSARIF